MAKKEFVPMTIVHEAFEMNQAVAACDYLPATKNAGAVVCNQCKTSPHYWYAFDNDLPVQALEDDILYISASEPIDAQCKIVLKATYGQGFYGSASGQVTDGYLEEPLVNTTMTAVGDCTAELEAWLSSGTDTASLIQNS